MVWLYFCRSIDSENLSWADLYSISISSMFQGDSVFNIISFSRVQCAGAGGLQGTCYSKRQCSSLQGTLSGTCAYNLGVCCISKWVDVCQTGSLGCYIDSWLHIWSTEIVWKHVTVSCAELLYDIFFYKRYCRSFSVFFLQFTGHVTHLRITRSHISPTLASLQRLEKT